MNVDEIIEVISQRMGGMSGKENQIQLELTVAQSKFEGAEPKPEILLNVTTPFVVDAKGVFAAPEGFLREFDAVDQSDQRTSALWVQSIEGALLPMAKERYSLLIQRYGAARGMPRWYDLVGSNFYVFPVPEDTNYYALQLWYYKSEPKPLSGSSNLWTQTYPEMLITRTGLTMSLFTGELGPATQMWTSLHTDALLAFQADNIARREANLRTVYGGAR